MYSIHFDSLNRGVVASGAYKATVDTRSNQLKSIEVPFQKVAVVAVNAPAIIAQLYQS